MIRVSPYSSFGDGCLKIIAALLILALLGLGGLLVFMVINTVGVTATKTVVTVVESKQVVAPSITTTFMTIGGVMIPSSISHPESYYLHFKIDGNKLGAEVEKKLFDTLSAGDAIEVDYGFGRLNGAYRPVQIRPIPNK